MGFIVVLLLVVAIVQAYPVLSILALACLGVLLALWRLGERRKREASRQRAQALTLADVDSMSGIAFEDYVERLLAHRGFRVEATKTSGDLGVDLVARGEGGAFAIQVKRQRKPVSRRAVSDAVGGMAHYGCTSSMVITNATFTNGARELALSNKCRLIDREELGKWALDLQLEQRS